MSKCFVVDRPAGREGEGEILGGGKENIPYSISCRPFALGKPREMIP
jgi:hypothetical protein